MENLTNTAVHLLEDSQGADLTRREKRKLSVEITTAMIALVCLVTGLLYKGIFPEQTAVAGLIYSVGVLVEGLPLLATAIRGFLQRDVTNAMEILVSIAVLACYITGQHELAILIPVVLSVVHFLEERSIMGGRDAIEGLKQMQATDAVLETEDGEVTVEVQALKRGDIIIVRPGMGLPIDGTVIWGNSNIDQKSLTGEPLPAAVTVGDTVYAGTTNLDGMIKVRVEKEYQDTSFTKIVSLLEEAQSITVPEIRIVDRFMPHRGRPHRSAQPKYLQRHRRAGGELSLRAHAGQLRPHDRCPGGVHQAGHPHQKRQIRGAAHQHHHCDL